MRLCASEHASRQGPTSLLDAALRSVAEISVLANGVSKHRLVARLWNLNCAKAHEMVCTKLCIEQDIATSIQTLDKVDKSDL